MPVRDDFNETVKRSLAARVGTCCSNPACGTSTSGPSEDPIKTTSIGVAAHITAAAPGGPRYDAHLTPGQRSAIENAIWLCQNCSRLIDSDPLRFPIALLREWKSKAEAEARMRLGRPASASKPTPSYPDPETQRLSEKLAAAQIRKQRLQQRGADTTEVQLEILDLKRQLREGGQIRPGDSLGDGRYLLLDVLGRGGFATVWRGHDVVRDEIVAVKVLHSNLAGDPVRLARFRRSARIMDELKHEAVVRILQPCGEDGRWHYFVMEYMPGGDLRRAVIERRIDCGQALQMIHHVCGGLAEAHVKGIVHRDIKPANILLDENLIAKLSDFDLVNVGDSTGGTRTGALGSTLYAAAELLSRPMDADARADVFGLALTTVFCLHGRELDGSIIGRADRLIETLSCGAPLKAVLKRAANWEDPAARYPNAAAFQEALEGTLCDVASLEVDPRAIEAAGRQTVVPPLHLDRLTLSNLKNIDSIELDLPGQAICLVGQNGAGKTTVLQGIALALLGENALRKFDQDALKALRRRVGTVFMASEIRAWVREGETRQELYIPLGACGLSQDVLHSHPSLVQMRDFWARREASHIFAAYGTKRDVSWYVGEQYATLAAHVRPDMGLDHLSIPAVSSRFFARNDSTPTALLRTFAALVNSVFDEHAFRVVGDNSIEFLIDRRSVSFDELPTGYRSLVKCLLDLCTGWHERAPDVAERGDFASLHGVLLIDEIDLHLHARWQRTIAPRLREILPSIQLIVSTHSPVVASSFDLREIIIIEDGKRIDLRTSAASFFDLPALAGGEDMNDPAAISTRSWLQEQVAQPLVETEDDPDNERSPAPQHLPNGSDGLSSKADEDGVRGGTYPQFGTLLSAADAVTLTIIREMAEAVRMLGHGFVALMAGVTEDRPVSYMISPRHEPIFISAEITTSQFQRAIDFLTHHGLASRWTGMGSIHNKAPGVLDTTLQHLGRIDDYQFPLWAVLRSDFESATP